MFHMRKGDWPQMERFFATIGRKQRWQPEESFGPVRVEALLLPENAAHPRWFDWKTAKL